MGPLKGLKIIEMAALGPGPFAGMMLADMGAEVIIIDRHREESASRVANCHTRGKKSISLNLKDADDIETLLKLVEKADVLFEGFRPGVMERLGIGPTICMQRNPRLIYGRMTGWGQTGPLAKAAGHDINYIALTGVLHAIGHQESRPVPPLNLVGDYGGGGMFLVTGILAAIIERQNSGLGQVIDVAMTDGSAVLMSIINTLDNLGFWQAKRGSNWLDSGTHYYDTYETKDQKYISIGAIEPQFYRLLIDTLALDPKKFNPQMDPANWPILKAELVQVFKTKTRAEWCEIMEGTDICFAPVLDYKEAPHHPHHVARKTYLKVDEMIQPAPAPRFSRTASEVQFGSHAMGEDTEAILKEWGIK